MAIGVVGGADIQRRVREPTVAVRHRHRDRHLRAGMCTCPVGVGHHREPRPPGQWGHGHRDGRIRTGDRGRQRIPVHVAGRHRHRPRITHPRRRTHLVDDRIGIDCGAVDRDRHGGGVGARVGGVVVGDGVGEGVHTGDVGFGGVGVGAVGVEHECAQRGLGGARVGDGQRPGRGVDVCVVRQHVPCQRGFGVFGDVGVVDGVGRVVVHAGEHGHNAAAGVGDVDVVAADRHPERVVADGDGLDHGVGGGVDDGDGVVVVVGDVEPVTEGGHTERAGTDGDGVDQGVGGRVDHHHRAGVDVGDVELAAADGDVEGGAFVT